MLWRIDHSDPNHPEGMIIPADDLHYDPNRRSVIFFPGADIDNTTGRHVKAGNIRLIEKTISCSLRAHPNIDIYLYTYEKPYEDYGACKAYYAGRDEQNYYSMQAYRDGLAPLLCSTQKSLADLGKDELKQRLSHITCITQCYGSLVQQGLVNVFAASLGRDGFSDCEITEIMSELVAVSIASVAHATLKGRPAATQFHFTADNDTTAMNGIYRQCANREQALQQLENCGYGKAVSWLRKQPMQRPFAELLKDYADNVRVQAETSPKPTVKQIETNQYRIGGFMPDTHVCWVEPTRDGKEKLRTVDSPATISGFSSVVHDYRNFLYAASPMGISLLNVVNNALSREVGIGDGHRLLMNTKQSMSQHADRASNQQRARQLEEMQRC